MILNLLPSNGPKNRPAAERLGVQKVSKVRYYTVTKSDRILEGHSKFPPQRQKTFVSDTGKNFTLSKPVWLTDTIR